MVLKLLGLQLFWFVIVKYMSQMNGIVSVLFSVIIVLILSKISKNIRHKEKFFLFVVFTTLWGTIQELVLFKFNIISTSSFPIWMVSLWILICGYYIDFFSKFKSTHWGVLSVLGSLCALASYHFGIELSQLTLNPDREKTFYLIVLISWSLYFPISIKALYSYSFLDHLLDRLIVFSFDKSGYYRHAEFFDKDTLVDLSGKNVLVTGGTSGIGLSVAKRLHSFGATVYITGRSIEKGKMLEVDGLHFIQMDMSDWKELKQFSLECVEFDHLIFNAGGMPEKMKHNEYEVEHQAASQLFGHYYLLKYLNFSKKIVNKARIIWVSSGGMYLKKLSLDELVNKTTYDKVDTYANVKRAQVSLVEELSKMSEWDGFSFYSMHPGWVDTTGIQGALPKFHKFTSKRLRTCEQGGDTIVWLIVKTVEPERGKFYFDRRSVSPYISNSFIPSSKDRERLMELLERYDIF
ncbi:SDR family NAD(P)-dependent oxidoreductase [Halobacteriovorax sp. HLS]|uniref:SDR family NAD(P)-dependent oxidoreductase n=1 Tax=Halobacteriovorax sp. HLS TaxID=2234000 RepID=UPI0013E3762F|nr:SDR family NAD(P)-dependent oxidoreductase [Halobacteriovorax sp. HLS]